MINSFTTFSKAIARTNLETNSLNVIEMDEDYNLLAHIEIGIIYDRIINYSNFSIELSKNIIKRIYNARLELKNELKLYFTRIQIINPFFYELISNAFKKINKNVENENISENNKDQIILLIQDIFDSVEILKNSFKKIEEIIQKIPKKGNSIEDYIYLVNEELNNNIIQHYQLISEMTKNYKKIKIDNCKDYEISNSEERMLRLMLQASIQFDELSIKLRCLSVDPIFNEISSDSSSINQIFDTLNEILESAIHLSYNSPMKILNEVMQLSIKFDEIIKVINIFFEKSINSTNGFFSSDNRNCQLLLNISTSVSISKSILNKIESISSYSEIEKIVNSLHSIFFGKRLSDEYISTAIQLISAFSKKVDILTESEITKQYLSASFNSLSNYLKEKCTDLDSTLFGLISTVRIIAQIYPDSEIGEKLLSNLYKTISEINKSFVIKCKKRVIQFMNLIEDNLEYFENYDLNDSNFYFTAIIEINESEFDFESDHFISLQQQFYDFFGSSYRSFKQIASNCQEKELRNKLQSDTDHLLKLGIRYTNWLNQFYLTICSMAHLRLKLILDIFSFPIFLLDPSSYTSFLDDDASKSYSSDNEEIGNNSDYDDEEENSEKKSSKNNLVMFLSRNISNIQNLLDKTPQFLLCDIGDIYKLIRAYLNISNNFNQFTECFINMNDSPFYPIIHSSIISLLELFSRNIPNCVISILSLSNFSDTDYFCCLMNASATYSFFNLQKEKEIIENEKLVSPIFISPSYFLILSAISIAESTSNKANAKQIISNLSSIYSQFKHLWSKSIQFINSDQNEEDSNNSNSDSDQNEEDSNDLNLDNLLNSLKDFLKQIDQISQPSIPYKIPKPILELKQYKHTISLMQNKSVIKFSQFLIQNLFAKKNINVHSHNFLNSWFNKVLSLYIEFNELHNYKYKEIGNQFTFLEELLKKRNKCDFDCYSSFIKYLSESSIFIAYKEDEFSNEEITELHKKIILISFKYFTFKSEQKNDENSFKSEFQLNKNFFDIYNCLCKIFYGMKSYQLTEDSVLKVLSSSYKNVIQIIDFVLKQKKQKEANKHHQININVPHYIKSLNELSIYENLLQKIEGNQEQKSIEKNELISEFIDYIIENNQNYNHKYYKICKIIEKNGNENDYSNESKILSSCISKYNKLFPIQSNLINSIEKENLQSEVKSCCLKFRNSVMNYITENKNFLNENKMNQLIKLEKKKHLNDHLNNAYQSINVILIYLIHLLKHINSPSQQKSIQFIRNLSKIQVIFIKFLAFLNKINSGSKSSINRMYQKALKKLKRIVQKVNDTNNSLFQYNEELNENENEKSDLFTVLTEIIVNISKLNEFASFCFISEMYENEYVKNLREQSIEKLNENFSKLKEAMNQIETNTQSDESSSPNLHDVLTQSYEVIESSLKKFIENSNSIEFNQNSEYFKNLMQSNQKAKKKKKKEKSNTNQEQIINEEEEEANEEEDEIEEDIDESKNDLDDAEFSFLSNLSSLFSPQFHIFNSIFSIMNELSKEKITIIEVKGTDSNLASLIQLSNHFPSPPNLLKSYFLCADIEPYVGFRNNDNDRNRQLFAKYCSNKENSKEEEKERKEKIITNELVSNSLTEKHIRRYAVAMRQANDSYDVLNRVLGEFNKIASDKKSEQGEITVITKKLKEATDDYAEKVLQITYFTKKNKSLQVEQLIELHKFVDSVNELQNALKQRLTKGNEMIRNVNKVIESTADQFRSYNHQCFEKGGKGEGNKEKDQDEEELNNSLDQEITVLMKLNESHNQIKRILKDVNMIIKEENVNNNDSKASKDNLKPVMGPIMISISYIIKRAKELTRNRIIQAKMDELKRNPIIIDSKGNITRRTSINDINIKLENEEGLIKSSQELQNAAKMLFLCFESQSNQQIPQYNFNININNSISHEYKIIASLNSIKHAISALISQILFIGGDPNRIMNNYVKELNDLIGSITEKVEKSCHEKLTSDFLEKNYLITKNVKDDDVTRRVSPMINSLNFNFEISVLKADFELKKNELRKFQLESK